MSAKKNRGTGDELEVLCMIISENIGLKNRILEKIRQVRAEKLIRDLKNNKADAGAAKK